MKFITVALMGLLLAGMFTRDADAISLHVYSSNCCYDFLRKKLPLKNIQCYINTSSSCSYEAFILKLKNGRKACVLKTANWVHENFRKMKPCPIKET
ncbi:PREDICTED: c-C motif chemokine 1 [Elephantulus edwardii]|uniref:c-C motif chemokine 1 n=1 Tax=Elephantulus edwardii TaxID=28737 RepID=UPI0003F083EA|nr:PREDICTED: c-C motif chemokine 1 [Elephantulus edwardii]